MLDMLAGSEDEVLAADDLEPGDALEADPDPIVYVDGWALIDHDPVTGKEVYALATDDGKMRVREVMPVADLLAENAELQVDNLNAGWRGDMPLAARVPIHVWQKCLAPAIVQGDKGYIRRWLNDPDHAAFRARAGLV